MYRATPWESYRQTAMLTAPPGQLILLLFEGAIQAIERGLEGFSRADLAELNMTVNNNFQRAQNIIRELNVTLDMEKGGVIAATLRPLYDYFDQRLTESNLRKNRHGADEVLAHLKELREAWATMLRQGEPPATSSPLTQNDALLAAN